MFKRKYKKNFSIFLMIIALVSIVSFSAVSYAKYVELNEANALIEPDEFVFTCDKIENKTYIIEKDSTSFTVSNKELSKVSAVDITFSVVVLDGSTPFLNETHTFTGNVESSKTITLNNLQVDHKYIVTVSSTTPYVKKFNFMYYVASSLLTNYYTVTDNSTWIELDLFIGNVLPTNNITITYGSNLVPDNSNDLMEDWDNQTVGTIDVSELTVNTHYSLAFFKLTSQTYNVSKTTLSDDGTINIGG